MRRKQREGWSHGKVELEILQTDTFELVFPLPVSWDYSRMLLCPIWQTALSKAKTDSLVIHADYRTDSVTGYGDANHFYHEGSWRMKGTDPVCLTLQVLNTRCWGNREELMKN